MITTIKELESIVIDSLTYDYYKKACTDDIKYNRETGSYYSIGEIDPKVDYSATIDYNTLSIEEKEAIDKAIATRYGTKEQINELYEDAIRRIQCMDNDKSLLEKIYIRNIELVLIDGLLEEIPDDIKCRHNVTRAFNTLLNVVVNKLDDRGQRHLNILSDIEIDKAKQYFYEYVGLDSQRRED